MALGKKVLVVDDEDTIRETLALGLSDFGWEVTKCPNCSSALKHDTPFDVYLIDLSLPGEDGLQLAAGIKKKFGKVPIVLLTGYLTESLEKEAKKCSISAIVRKPFKFEELDKVLNEVCAKKKAN